MCDGIVKDKRSYFLKENCDSAFPIKAKKRMSFKESVIIPIETYRQCRFDKRTPELDILTSTSLPSDVKMKLYDQMKLKTKKMKTSPIKRATFSTDFPPVKDILNKIPTEDQPFVQSILDKIKQRPEEIKWNNNEEIMIDGQLLHGSNISEIFQFLTKNLTVTSSKDVPVGTDKFYNKLILMNIPKSWIKNKPMKRSTRSQQKRKHQSSSSTDEEQPHHSKWISMK